MILIKKLLHKLNGLHYPQDYLCLDREPFQQPLYVYLVSKNHIVSDITNQHVFAGYQPVIFVLQALPGRPLGESIQVAFSVKAMEPNDIFQKKDAIAFLSMKKIQDQDEAGVVFYEALKGNHHFVSGFHQSMAAISNMLYNKKPGNVFLKGNLFSQVQIAYSVPRNISLVTLGENELYNLFPTDLHGPMGADHYIISLRHAGKACRQAETVKKIIVSPMDPGAYKMVYSLGKNHMQELKPKDNFPFSERVSDVFHLPLPELALGYAELGLETSFVRGIHKLLVFKIVHTNKFPATPTELSHIHNSYATWRYNNRLAGNYLLR